MLCRELQFCSINKDEVYSFFMILGKVVLNCSKISAIVVFFHVDKRLSYLSYPLKNLLGHEFTQWDLIS